MKPKALCTGDNNNKNIFHSKLKRHSRILRLRQKDKILSQERKKNSLSYLNFKKDYHNTENQAHAGHELLLIIMR